MIQEEVEVAKPRVTKAEAKAISETITKSAVSGVEEIIRGVGGTKEFAITESRTFQLAFPSAIGAGITQGGRSIAAQTQRQRQGEGEMQQPAQKQPTPQVPDITEITEDIQVPDEIRIPALGIFTTTTLIEERIVPPSETIIVVPPTVPGTPTTPGGFWDFGGKGAGDPLSKGGKQGRIGGKLLDTLSAELSMRDVGVPRGRRRR